MMCPHCHGSGKIEDAVEYHYPEGHQIDRAVIRVMICPECAGLGQVSCCQGHEGQPEPD